MNLLTLAPYYRNEEIISQKRLDNYLHKLNYNTYNSNLEILVMKAVSENIISDDKIKILINLSLAMDIYYMVDKANICISVINGRVPDESTLVKSAIAYVLGVPVLLYKNDIRTTFTTGDNSMILGLSDYKLIRSLDKLKKKITVIKKLKSDKITISNLSPYMKILYEIGKDVYDFFLTFSKKEDILDLLIIKFQLVISEIDKLDKDEITIGDYKRCPYEVDTNRVYCSGPLFCPEEHREMQCLADELKANKFDSYLPERDGAEPLVMSSANNPFAASILVKPITNYINKVLFRVDVAEIISCSYFLININGRAYDDGAMVELGIAFAIGKPITIFYNDMRGFINGRIHPIIQALAYWSGSVGNYDMVYDKVRNSRKILANITLNSGNNTEIKNKILTDYRKGMKYIKLINRIKKPENKMLKWLEEYDE